MSSPVSMDPKRLGGLVGRFSAAFVGTPEDDDLVDRTSMALRELPDDVVRELGEVVDMLAGLTRERLGDT